MKLEWIKSVALAITLLLTLSSCNNSGTVAEGGIGGSGISMGSVANIGSIWVNGVEYDTTGATIAFADEGVEVPDSDGSAGGTSVLPGMVVTVEGSVNADRVSGTATRVTYADSLEGPIDAIPVVNGNTLVVLGQTVIVDNLSKDQNGNPLNDVSSFSVGEVVEVSGYVDANGAIRATYIEKTGSAELELKGVVDSVSTGSPSYTFTIGALTVDTSAIGQDAGSLLGEYVMVKGSSYDSGTMVLTSSSVEIASSSLSSDDYAEAEMSGIVTRVDSATSFVLGGQSVYHDGNTEFNGGLAADIVSGTWLEVEGSLVGGLFTAEQINFQDGIELEGDVASTGAGTVTMVGLAGITIQLDDEVTQFEGDALQAAEIQVGHHLKIRGRETSSGSGSSVLAMRIESAASSSTDLVLQGPLQGKAQPTVQVLGMSVDTSGMSYELDSALTSVDATTFFNTVNVGDLVILSGSWDGSSANWSSIEIDQ